MALWQVREVLNEISKKKFEKLYNISLEELYEDGFLGDTGLIPHYLKKSLDLKIEKYSNTDSFPKNPVVFLMENNIKEKLKIIPKKSVNYIRGYVDAFDYSDNLVDIFDLLSKYGCAVITLPATDYPKLFKKIKNKKELYINALFSSMDDRKNIKEIDKKYLMPIECKCICVVITRRKTKSVLTCLEYSDVYTDEDDVEISIDKLFKNELSISRKKDKLNEIYSGELVAYKADSIENISSLYITEDLSNKAKVYENTRKLKELGDFHETDHYHLFIYLDSYDNEGFNQDKFNKNKEEFKNAFRSDKENDDFSDVKESNLYKMITFSSKVADYEPNPIISQIDDVLIFKQTIIEHECNLLEILRPIDWISSHHEGLMADSEEVKYLIMFLNEDTNNDYLLRYLNSYEGIQKQRKVLAENNCDINSYREIDMPFFREDEQASIVSAIQNSEKLSSELESLAKNILENPTKSKEVDKTLKDWIIKLDKLSLDEKIITLASEGESDKLEYKSTFSLDIETNKKADYLEHSVFKTIAGFLNSRGGILLVGVNDSGQIDGINEEVRIFDGNNEDKFLLRFLNKLKSKENFGQKFFPFIEYRLVNVIDKLVLYIKCKESSEACFITKQGQELFYSRQNPGTIELRGNEMVKYINNRFKE